MIYARQPTPEERSELQQMTRQEIGRVSQRAQMILLSAQGHPVPELATLFARSRATVRLWLRRFDVAGPRGLYDAPRSGRPRKVSAAVAHTLLTLIRDDPRHAGFLATSWTVAMLGLAVLQTMAVSLSASTVRTALHALPLRWGRPRLAMPRKVDPEKTRKQWAIVKAVVAAGPAAAILYADESRIELLPLVRALWQWVGHQIRIPTPGTNVTRTLFGALNIRTGRWVYLVRERMRQEDFLAFLKHLLVAYPTEPIVLIVDNYSSHTARAVSTWLATQPRLHLCYLPTHCSHLNPVERIWLRLKNAIAANRLYGSMTMLLDTTAAFFEQMPPKQALIWAGI